ncbi:hypothetical protein NB705_000730 [Xanthomonas sacchari]|nr:hypothetical protein [Xanthomonas sacchari]
MHHRLDPAQHVRGDAAGAAEDVQRHAAGHRRARRRIAQRQVDVVDVVAAVVGLLGLVLAVGAVDVPEPGAVGALEAADEAGADVLGVHALLEHARTAFHRAAPDHDQVAARIQREAERVVRVGGGDDDAVGQRIAGAGVGAEEDRFRCGLVGRLAAVAEQLQVPLHVVVEEEAELAEHALALGRGQQQVGRGEVVAVGGGEAVVVVAAGAAAGAVVTRRARTAVRGQVLLGAGVGVDEDETPVRGGRAAEAQAGAGNRIQRLRAVARVDRILLGVAGAEEQAGALGAVAPGQVHALAGAVALVVLAVVQGDLAAFEIAPGDDVDHAGDGIGAVQRGGAVFQHLDAFDDGQRDGVEIGGRAHARGGGLVDPAHAVDQHQHALGAEMAQVDLRRTRADAAAVRREAEIAGGVELGVQGRAGGGELLQHIADGGQAGAFDVGAAQGLHRHLALHFRAADAGAGDLHAVQRGGRAGSGRGRLLLGAGDGGDAAEQGQGYREDQRMAVQEIHPSLSPERMWVGRCDPLHRDGVEFFVNKS